MKKSQEPVKRGAGYGLEVPCVCLYGPNIYVDKMKALVESLPADGHYNLCNSDFVHWRFFVKHSNYFFAINFFCC